MDRRREKEGKKMSKEIVESRNAPLFASFVKYGDNLTTFCASTSSNAF